MPRWFFVLTLIPLVGFAGEPTSDDGEGGEAAAAKSADLQRWIQNLDAESYQARETAERRLRASGIEAIKPLQEAISEGSLEVTVRGMRVLSELAISQDPATESAVREALEVIADLQVTSAARRAREVLDSLNGARQQAGLDRLKRLGAHVDDTDYQFSTGHEQISYFITIDERWRGTAEDVKLLSWIVDARKITLDGPMVDDQWIKQLADLQSLREVSIKKANVSPKGFGALRDLDQIEILELINVPVDDELVDHLEGMKAPVMVKLYGTELTEKGRDRLAQLWPHSNIDYRRGAFLGVGGDVSRLGCLITNVQPGTAAARAGLSVGDVIIRYDGHPVGNFEELTKLIAQHRPGETVEIEVERDGERFTRSVTLGAWN